MSKYTFDENLISDLYKDVHSHRPTDEFWKEWNSMSDDAKQALWDKFCDRSEKAAKQETEERKKAAFEFDKKLAALTKSNKWTIEDTLYFLTKEIHSAIKKHEDWPIEHFVEGFIVTNNLWNIEYKRHIINILTKEFRE